VRNMVTISLNRRFASEIISVLNYLFRTGTSLFWCAALSELESPKEIRNRSRFVELYFEEHNTTTVPLKQDVILKSELQT
jgi:hypothetical protein